MTVILLKVRFQRPLLAGMRGCSLFSLLLVAIGLDPSLVVILVAAFIAGMAMEIFGIGWNLAMQENIDESMLSRAYSYDMLGSFVAIPVGQLLFGPLGDRWGVQDVILWAGVAYDAICLLTLPNEAVRRLRRGKGHT